MEQTSFLNPARIIDSLGIEEGWKVAEFVSGTGFFSIAFAQKVGRDGKIYAVDVQKDTLEALKAKARLEGVYNLECIWADLERPGASKIAEGSLDFVAIPNMLFQSEKKPEILKEAWRILKPAGRVAVIDWIPEKAIFGKRMGWLVGAAEMQKLCEKAGFTFLQNVDTGSPYHYGLLFTK